MQIVEHVRRRVTNAWTVLSGARGEITRQAERRGQSRQALYRDADAVVTALDGTEAQSRFARLETRIAEQAARIEQLEADRQHAVAINAEVQAAFASTAQAEGVSLPVARRLLAVLLGAATPSVATLGRFSQDAARRSSRLLEVLDAEAASQVTRVTADEIFPSARQMVRESRKIA